MDKLAGPGDYIARFGGPGTAELGAMLDDASSFIRETAGIPISLVEGDTATIRGDGSRSLILPSLPVVDLGPVLIDGVTLASDRYRWTEWGMLHGINGHRWRPNSKVKVTYTHGFDPVPGWVVSLVCSTVQRALRPAAQLGVAAQTTGSQTVQYQTSLAGVNLWLTKAEIARLRDLGGKSSAR